MGIVKTCLVPSVLLHIQTYIVPTLVLTKNSTVKNVTLNGGQKDGGRDVCMKEEKGYSQSPLLTSSFPVFSFFLSFYYLYVRQIDGWMDKCEGVNQSIRTSLDCKYYFQHHWVNPFPSLDLKLDCVT